jgi:broad specificity phosphatase PhoE
VIYLVRHGETEWNRAGRMQGQLDSPLTERGQAQARAVGETLAGLTNGGDGLVMVASPLGRTMATAALIAEALGPTNIATDERIMEMSWGDWDGMTHPEIETHSPGELDRRKAGRWDHQPPGGESYATTALRVAGFLADVDPEQPLVVVSHGGTGRVIRGLYGKLSQDEMLILEQPQDAFHLLRNGQIGRIDSGK